MVELLTLPISLPLCDLTCEGTLSLDNDLQVLAAGCISVNGWPSKYLADLLTLLNVHSDQVKCEWMQTCNHGLQELGQSRLSVNDHDIMNQ